MTAYAIRRQQLIGYHDIQHDNRKSYTYTLGRVMNPGSNVAKYNVRENCHKFSLTYIMLVKAHLLEIDSVKSSNYLERSMRKLL